MNIFARRYFLALTLTVLIVLSGCSGPPGWSDTSPPTTEPTTTDSPRSTEDVNDQRRGTIGRERGYWHDDPLSIDNSDGLNRSELDIVTARSMARVEYIRDAEFAENVTVEVQSREEYKQSSPFAAETDTIHNKWNNQVWEGLFIVDESTDVGTAFEKFYGGGVLGYYSPGEDKLVVVSDSPNSLRVSESTLIHELAHALQDQRENLSKPEYSPVTQDAQLASNGLIEGEAKYIENRYRNRCGSEWTCLDEPSHSSSANVNIGIQLIVFQPYADGPEYIDHLIQTDGWSAVDDAFANPPTKTSEIIRPGTELSSHEFEALPTRQGDWTTFDGVGDSGSDSVGEASLFVMLWYQNHAYGIETIDRGAIRDSSGDLTYSHQLSEGLVDDRLTPYQNGEKRGYIWRLHWQSEEDATEFKQSYHRILMGHGGERVESGMWTIESGGFADSFYIEQDGRTLTIVNAPSNSEIAELYPESSTLDGEETR